MGDRTNGRWEDPYPLQVTAYRHWGFEGQVNKLIEEIGELLQAISRYEDHPTSKRDLYEELVGVRSLIVSLDEWARDEIGEDAMTSIQEVQGLRLRKALEDSGADL